MLRPVCRRRAAALISAGCAPFAAEWVSAASVAEAQCSSTACSDAAFRHSDGETEDVSGLLQLREGSFGRGAATASSPSTSGRGAAPGSPRSGGLERSAQCSTELADIDPVELAVLAQDACDKLQMKESALAAIGWSRGPWMKDPTNSRWEADRAKVFQKGCRETGEGTLCDYCAVAFSPTDDFFDSFQDYNTTFTPFCGIEAQHGGYVQQLRNYYDAKSWDAVLRSFSGCCRSYAVGESMGGAIASLFAFCANARATSENEADRKHFEGLSSPAMMFELVTFGLPRTGKVPLYNRDVGASFQGARHVITDGRVPAFTSEAGLEFLDHLAATYWDMWMLIAWMKLRRNLITLRALQGLSLTDRFDELYEEVVNENRRYAIIAVFAVVSQVPLPWMTAATSRWSQYIHKYEDLLTWSFDPVPALDDHELFHPFLKISSLAHPAPAPPAADFGRAGWKTTEPGANYLQLLGGILGNSLGNSEWMTQFYPNHFGCCYIEALGGLSAHGLPGGCGEVIFGNASHDCPLAKWR